MRITCTEKYGWQMHENMQETYILRREQHDVKHLPAAQVPGLSDSPSAAPIGFLQLLNQNVTKTAKR
ncbi:hypothetical protein NDU88_002178 [Pleurodeles waltl]|uniref:Uncharacterized protein n=1 Tax=Pleurodeles waltl TaxID=8319 RepID=A0AAV7M1M4_PLEWA|nr:hypothetical protein NDU88_002178 [Pleurodeles waltl]